MATLVSNFFLVSLFQTPMDIPKLSASESKAAAVKTLESLENPSVSFGTFGLDGWINLRVLAVSAHDGIDTLWFCTTITEQKVAELKANSKASVYGFDPQSMSEFRLFGSVELLSDPASRRKAWREDFLQYFPEGVDSPTMIILKFTTDHGQYVDYKTGTGTF